MATKAFTIHPREPDSEKQVLLIAAVFHERFNVDWLAELTGLKATQLLSTLEKRVKNGRLTSDTPGIYAFRDKDLQSTLIRELSAKQQKDLHQRIAGLLMDELTENTDSPHLLSHHLLQISNDLEGCQCLIKAGEMHLRQYNNEVAFQCYAKAIKDLSILAGEEVDRLFSETAIKYSKLSTARHDTSQVLLILYDALGRAESMENVPIQVLLRMHIAKNEWLKARYAKALAAFEKGWGQAKTLNDSRLMRAANTFSTFFLYWQGRFREVVENYEKSVPEVDKLPMGQFPLLAANTVGYCYSQIGQVTQGLGMLDTIRTFCAERGDLYLSSYAIGNMGAIMLTIRRLDEAIDYLYQASRESQQAHNEWVWIHVRIMMSYAYYLKGEKKKCIRCLKEFLEKSRKVQATVLPYPYLLALSLAMKEGKLPQVKGISLEDEINAKLRGKNLYSKSLGYRYRSYVHQMEKDPVEQSIKCLQTARKWAEQSGHVIEQTRVNFDLARLYLYQGQKERAEKLATQGAVVLRRFNESLIPDDFRSLVDRSSQTDDMFKTILSITREVAAIRGHKDLVQHIISTVNRLTGAERGAIFLLEREGVSPALRIRGSKNLTSAHINHHNFVSSMKLIEEGGIIGLAEQATAEARGIPDGLE